MKWSLDQVDGLSFSRVANSLAAVLENSIVRGILGLFYFFDQGVFFDFPIYSIYSRNFALFFLLLESLVHQGGWALGFKILFKKHQIYMMYESRISF